MMSFVASLTLFPLLYFEHTRTVRSSTIMVIYLFISLICDAIQARTLYLIDGISNIGVIYMVNIWLKVAFLFLEVRDKQQYLKNPYLNYPLETRSDVFSRTFFWWLLPLFVEGYRNILRPEDLPKIPNELASEPLREKMMRAWDERCKPRHYNIK